MKKIKNIKAQRKLWCSYKEKSVHGKNCNALNQSKSVSSKAYQSCSPIKVHKTVNFFRE